MGSNHVTLRVRSSTTLNTLCLMEGIPTDQAVALVSEWLINGALGSLLVEILGEQHKLELVR